MSQHYIGIDGGGTHTRSLLADQNGQILGSGQSGSSNRNHHPRSEVRENLRAAILAATGGKTVAGNTTIFLGMCGVSNDADRNDILSIIREIPEVPAATTIAVENDAKIGLIGGLSGRPGLVLIAGTGSACMGINRAGQSYWCGGWGALADDCGSAPWMGIRAIQTAVRAEDGRGQATALRDMVFTFLGLHDPRELIDRIHNQDLSRKEIGSLAPRIITAMTNGDEAATTIVREAIEELSSLVRVTASRLFNGENAEMILVGGLALSGPPFQTMLIEKIHESVPDISVREPEMSPVEGAILEAMRTGGVVWTDSILNQVRKGKR